MPLLRLIGLTLFITAIFLAMVAAITKTTHLQVQIPGLSGSQRSSSQSGRSQSVPPQSDASRGGWLLPPRSDGVVGDTVFGDTGFGGPLPQTQAGAIAFTSVPIVWPLIIAAGMGLLMWFTHPGERLRGSNNGAKRRARRRR